MTNTTNSLYRKRDELTETLRAGRLLKDTAKRLLKEKKLIMSALIEKAALNLSERALFLSEQIAVDNPSEEAQGIVVDENDKTNLSDWFFEKPRAT